MTTTDPAEVLARQRQKAAERKARYLAKNPAAPNENARRRREAGRKLRARHEDEYQALLAIEVKAAPDDPAWKRRTRALQQLRLRHEGEWRDVLAATS